jgi:prepilin signal peptidase PulO-like enzyme (type II secretory pathway)
MNRSLFDPTLSTRRWLKVGLAVGGAVAGALFGIVLTALGKIVADAPPATLANYAWNATVFGVLAVVVGAGALLLVLPPAGLVLGFVRLARRYREPHTLPPNQATEGGHIAPG